LQQFDPDVTDHFKKGDHLAEKQPGEQSQPHRQENHRGKAELELLSRFI